MSWALAIGAWFIAAFAVIAALRWLARAAARKRAMPKRERVHLSRAERKALRGLSDSQRPTRKRADRGAP